MTAKHPEGLKKKELKRFRDLLLEKKEEILKNAKRTLNEDMTLDQDDLPDEMDLASSEYLQSFTFRLRGREKSFLDKITKALAKRELTLTSARRTGIRLISGSSFSSRRTWVREMPKRCDSAPKNRPPQIAPIL